MKLKCEMREQSPITCDFDALKHDAAAAHALMMAMKQLEPYHRGAYQTLRAEAVILLKQWGFDSGEES